MFPLRQRLYARTIYGLPFHLLPPRTPLERLRTHSLRERFRKISLPGRLVSYLLCVVTYPISLIYEVRRNLRHLRQRRPQAGARDAVRMYAMAISRNIPPTEFVTYGFDDPAQRANAPHYLYWTDMPIQAMLNRLRGADPTDVQDKARFTKLCTAQGFACAPILAESRGGQVVVHDDCGRYADLWLKPIHLNGSQGAERWARDAGTYRNDAGVSLTAEEWMQHVARVDCIVQPRLINHPTLQAVSNGALAAIRIVTVLPMGGVAQLISAEVGLPRGASKTTTGAICCVLDHQTGAITRMLMNQTIVQHAVHPDTGNEIAGIVVPYFQQALSMVLKAHAIVFPAFASLGWDVVITQDGPLLLETNAGWGALFQQQLEGPLGQTAFAHVVDQAVEQLRAS